MRLCIGIYCRADQQLVDILADRNALSRQKALWPVQNLDNFGMARDSKGVLVRQPNNRAQLAHLGIMGDWIADEIIGVIILVICHSLHKRELIILPTAGSSAHP